MTGQAALDLRGLVQANRVHPRVYTDPDIFDLEIRHVFGQAWNYVGHTSQTPRSGDYLTTKVASQPVVMLHHSDGRIVVVHNRCAHRGAKVLSEDSGNAKVLRCPYHGWTYATDGKLLSIPCPQGYAGAEGRADEFERGMPALRSACYRGFVFASLSSDGPELQEFLGSALQVLDNMVDRAPEGELEAAGGRFRTVQRNNWKIYLENLHDGMHPMIVHQSSIAASRAQLRKHQDEYPGEEPLPLQIVAANGQSYEQMRELEVSCDRYGHSFMRGFRNPRGEDPVFKEYVRRLQQRHGSERAEEILSTNFHNVNLYPNASAHPSFLQLRVVLPLSFDKTLLETWVFRLKGAPDELHRRNIAYANTVHSPSSIIKADDLETYRRVQDGLHGSGGWISQHRDFDAQSDDMKGTALNEHYVRNQYRAWLSYMSDGFLKEENALV